MKRRNPFMKSILLPLVLAACAAGVSGQAVVPPPLPIGSQQARPEAGLHLEERKRHVRAHHHKLHHKKDYTRPDDHGDGRHGLPGRAEAKDARSERAVLARRGAAPTGPEASIRNARGERCDRSDFNQSAVDRERK